MLEDESQNVGFWTGVSVKRHQDPDAPPPTPAHHGADGVLQCALLIFRVLLLGVLGTSLARRGAMLVRQGRHRSTMKEGRVAESEESDRSLRRERTVSQEESDAVA